MKIHAQDLVCFQKIEICTHDHSAQVGTSEKILPSIIGLMRDQNPLRLMRACAI